MSTSEQKPVNPLIETPAEQVDAQRRQFFRQAVASAFGAAAMMNMVPSAICHPQPGLGGWLRCTRNHRSQDRLYSTDRLCADYCRRTNGL